MKIIWASDKMKELLSKVFPNFPILLIVRFLEEHQTTFPLKNHWKIIEVIGGKNQLMMRNMVLAHRENVTLTL